MDSKKLLITATTMIVGVISVFISILPYTQTTTEKAKKANELYWEDAFGAESFAFDPFGNGPYTGIFDGRIMKFKQNKQWTNFAITSPNRQSQELGVVQIDRAIGPESFAFEDILGDGEDPYIGESDGRIIKWEQNEHRWINFAVTSAKMNGCEGEGEEICGRPLGLCFKKSNGDLYIADAYMGLLKVGLEGGLATTIATEAQGIPFNFCNGLDIDQATGIVYFTDSSSRFQRRNHMSIVLSGDRTGRLLKYDPDSKQVTVLLDYLSFPNGVALSQDSNYILLAETASCRILRYWLKTTNAGTLEVVAQLSGFPDNIKMSPRGGFWVGIHSRKKGISKLVLSYPWIGNILLKLPIDIVRIHSSLVKFTGNGGMAVRLSEEGKILEILEEKGGKRWESISEVLERDGNLWIGSVNLAFAGLYSTSQS